MGLCQGKETAVEKAEAALIKAAWNGDLATLTRLVTEGVNLEAKDQNGVTALMYAANSGKLGCLEHLIAKGANLEATCNRGWTALLWAAEYGKLGCLEHLVAKGANLEATNNQGRTALLWAAQYGKLGCLEHLIAKGANLEATNNNGITALLWAAQYGKLDCLEHLVAKGANLEATEENGITALLWAAYGGKLDCLEHLIAKGANRNHQNKEKRTALHYAAFYGHAPCVDSLLKAGADASLKDEDGDTALDDAKRRGHTEVVTRHTEVVTLLENAAIAAQAERAAEEKAAAEKAASEKATAAALGLLQPLEALSLDAVTLRAATAAAVTYCDAQGAASFADLVEHKLIVGLVASLALEPAVAKQLLNSLKAAALPEHLQLGVTLRGMRKLLLQLPSDAVEQVNRKMEEVNAKLVAKGKTPFPMNVAVNGYINQFFITCWEEEDNLTVCQRLQSQKSAHVGKATVFVSWFLETTIETLLDALDCFIKQKGLREEDTFFWVCDFVIRQTDVKKDLESLGDCVSALGHTVLLMEPWHAPKPLKRAYCIKEVYHTQASGAEFDMVMSTKEQETFETALSARDGFESIKAGLSKVDVRQAECRNVEDKNQILLELEQGVGSDECNRLVVGLMRKALVDQAKANQARQMGRLAGVLDGL